MQLQAKVAVITGASSVALLAGDDAYVINGSVIMVDVGFALFSNRFC